MRKRRSFKRRGYKRNRRTKVKRSYTIPRGGIMIT